MATKADEFQKPCFGKREKTQLNVTTHCKAQYELLNFITSVCFLMLLRVLCIYLRNNQTPCIS